MRLRPRRKRDVVMPHGPHDAGQLIRDGDDGLLPAAMRGDRHGPLLEPRQSIRRTLGELQRHPQNGPRAVGQETAEVDVASLTDSTEIPPRAGRRFSRRSSEPTGKLAPTTERVNVTDRADERRRRQHADAWDRL